MLKKKIEPTQQLTVVITSKFPLNAEKFCLAFPREEKKQR